MTEPETKTEQPPDAGWYYTADRHQKFGPFSLEELRVRLADGRLKPTHMCGQKGGKWLEASGVPGLLPSEEPETIAPPISSPVEPQSLPDGLPAEAEVGPFSKKFYRDLERLHQKIRLASDPKECLPILAGGFDRRISLLRLKRQRFKDDLKIVLRRAGGDPKNNLDELATRFANWRARTLEKLRGHLANLNDDDPLRSSISLFGTMDFGTRERAHTNVLAWLLHPQKDHKFGSVLLNAIWRHFEPDLAKGNLNEASVESVAEKLLPEGKRLDVFVQGNFSEEGRIRERCLVIEAKVDAQEGGNQLENYDHWIESELSDKGVTRVFLTPDGRPPETSNLKDIWKPLSFLELYCIFRAVLEQLQERPGYHFLRFYLTGILKDVCRWKLPIKEAENCIDPYGFVTYLNSVNKKSEKGGCL